MEQLSLLCSEFSQSHMARKITQYNGMEEKFNHTICQIQTLRQLRSLITN